MVFRHLIFVLLLWSVNSQTQAPTAGPATTAAPTQPTQCRTNAANSALVPLGFAPNSLTIYNSNKLCSSWSSICTYLGTNYTGAPTNYITAGQVVINGAVSNYDQTHTPYVFIPWTAVYNAANTPSNTYAQVGMYDGTGTVVAAETITYPLTILTGTSPYAVTITASTTQFVYGNVVDIVANFYRPSTNGTGNLNEMVRLRTDPPGCINHAAFTTDPWYKYFGKTLRVKMGDFPCCSVYFSPQSGSPNSYTGASNFLLSSGNANSVTCPACPNGYSNPSTCACSTPTANPQPNCVSVTCSPACPNGYLNETSFGCQSCNCAPCPNGYTMNTANTACLPNYYFSSSLNSWDWSNNQFKFKFNTCVNYPYGTTPAYLVFTSYSFSAGGYSVTLASSNTTCTNSTFTRDSYSSYACCQIWDATTAAIGVASAVWTGYFSFSTRSTYAAFQNQNAVSTINIAAIKPSGISLTQSPLYTVSSQTYSSQQMTYATNVFYNNNKMWTRLTVNNVSDCTTFKLNIVNASICQGSGATIASCSDSGSTSTTIYTVPVTQNQIDNWNPVVSNLGSCTSDIMFGNSPTVSVITPRQFVLRLYWTIGYSPSGLLAQNRENSGEGELETTFTLKPPTNWSA